MPPEDLLDRALASMQNLSEAAETMTRLLDGAVEGLARLITGILRGRVFEGGVSHFQIDYGCVGESVRLAGVIAWLPALPVSGGAVDTPIIAAPPILHTNEIASRSGVTRAHLVTVLFVLANESQKHVIQLVCAELLETLIAEMKRSYEPRARLGARLAGFRASRPLTRMCAPGRVGFMAAM